MFRPTTPADSAAIVALAGDTGVFYPHEIETLSEVLADYFAEGEADGQVMRTWDDNGTVIGFAHFCPAPMTLGTWELWWIAVSRARQGGGLGRRMLEFVESEIRRFGGERLFIETSATALYEPTRKFYLKCGYAEAARLPDYYRAGDDKVVFFKSLTSVVG